MNNHPLEVLRRNLRLLMEADGISEPELGRRAGLDQKTINNLFKPERMIAPRIETVEALAAYFRVSYYKLFIPDLPLELLRGQQLDKLTANFAAADTEGRRVVSRIAETEGAYRASDRAG